VYLSLDTPARNTRQVWRTFALTSALATRTHAARTGHAQHAHNTHSPHTRTRHTHHAPRTGHTHHAYNTHTGHTRTQHAARNIRTGHTHTQHATFGWIQSTTLRSLDTPARTTHEYFTRLHTCARGHKCTDTANTHSHTHVTCLWLASH
jgi:hypothetical protein